MLSANNSTMTQEVFLVANLGFLEHPYCCRRSSSAMSFDRTPERSNLGDGCVGRLQSNIEACAVREILHVDPIIRARRSRS